MMWQAFDWVIQGICYTKPQEDCINDKYLTWYLAFHVGCPPPILECLGWSSASIFISRFMVLLTLGASRWWLKNLGPVVHVGISSWAPGFSWLNLAVIIWWVNQQTKDLLWACTQKKNKQKNMTAQIRQYLINKMKKKIHQYQSFYLPVYFLFQGNEWDSPETSHPAQVSFCGWPLLPSERSVPATTHLSAVDGLLLGGPNLP